MESQIDSQVLANLVGLVLYGHALVGRLTCIDLRLVAFVDHTVKHLHL